MIHTDIFILSIVELLRIVKNSTIPIYFADSFKTIDLESAYGDTEFIFFWVYYFQSRKK